MLTPTKAQRNVIEKHQTHNLNHSQVGSGKTLMALESFKASLYKKLVIVCLPSKVRDWTLDGAEQGLDIKPLDSTPKRRGDVLRDPQTQLVAISFQSSWRTPELIGFIDKDTMIVFDESQCIANRTSKVTKFWMAHAKKAGHTYLMSGTPISNGMMEQWFSQLKIAGHYKGTWKSFRERYCVETMQFMAGKQFTQITGYRNVDELETILKEHSVAIKRDNKLIPSDIVIKVKSPKMYDVIKKLRTFEKDNGEIVALDTPSALFNGLRMSSNGYLTGIDKVAKNNKLDRLKDLLEECEGERVVITYQYVESYERLRAMIDRPLSVYNGSTKDLTAWNEYENAVLLVQHQAGSTGVNFMDIAHIMVFYEMPLSSIGYEQMKGRIARHTSTEDPVYYHLLADNITEQRIYDSVTNGVNVSTKLIEQWMEEI